MDYDTFVRERAAGRARAGIGFSTARRFTEHLPKKYQVAIHFWSWVWILSIPAFILIAVFFKWWVGLLLLVFVTPALSKSVKQAASEFVLRHATKDKSFYELLVSQGLLAFKVDDEV